jgi:regulator of sigma E protease
MDQLSGILSGAAYILGAVALLGVIVMFHELGHYLAGRALKIGIEEFSIGFGPKLIQWKRSDIKYSYRAVPLGGFCRFLGEDETAADPRALNNQPVWKRFIAILSGPVMNFVLAYIVTVVFFAAIGLRDAEAVPMVGQVMPDKPAIKAGLLAGDVVESVNGMELTYDEAGVEAIRRAIYENEGAGPVSLAIKRGEESLVIDIVPELDANGVYMVGIYFASDFVGEATYLPIIQNLRYSARVIANTMSGMLAALADMIRTGEGFEQSAGPVGIIDMVGQGIRSGFDEVLWLIIIISMNLGIMNLLPLPALDGGRLILLVIEGVRRKPMNREREGMIHLIGFGALIILILIFTYKDIMRLIIK